MSAVAARYVGMRVVRGSGAPGSPLDVLSDRELEVLAEVARARSNAAIAEVLFISERSVEKHVAAILWKLGIVDDGSTNRRVSAALLYLTHAAERHAAALHTAALHTAALHTAELPTAV